MTRSLLSMFAVSAFSLTAFADATPPAGSTPSVSRPGSGVEGVVVRGPIYPHVRPGQKETAPIDNTTIIVNDEAGKEVARTKTDKDGRYGFKLPPGKYTIVGPRNAIKPGKWTKEIEIKANQWQTLNIKIEMAIRTRP